MYKIWKRVLPRIKPFYAIKANGDPGIIEVLSHYGSGFDCASSFEINSVAEFNVNYSTNVIFANPCKQISNIETAKEKGIRWTTVDTIYEIEKLAQHRKEVELVIRLKVDDSKSVISFSSKFGASLDDCEELIETAKELGMKIAGVSFHVGTGCYDQAAYEKAINDAKVGKLKFKKSL
jgi:ornithine decarboxylase